MNEVLYPVAKTKHGQWLWITDATPAVEVYCPECDARMVARLGEIRQHHFAHLTASTACSGESGIHAAGKSVLAYTLEQLGEVSFQTNCPRPFALWKFCPTSSCLSIFHHLPISKVIVEKRTDDGFRPDLTIILQNGSQIFAEVVYKNPISDEKWGYFVKQGRPVIVWWIGGSQDVFHPPLTKSGKAIYHGRLCFPNPCNYKPTPSLLIHTNRAFHKTPNCPVEPFCAMI